MTSPPQAHVHSENPMGKAPPDTHTHLVLFETEHDTPFESAGLKKINNTSSLFPEGASTPDSSDLECCHYKLLEVFTPENAAVTKEQAPLVLQTEIEVNDVNKFRKYEISSLLFSLVCSFVDF